MELPKKYKKEFASSYALGPFPTFELINSRPNEVTRVFCSESFNEKEKLSSLCDEKNIEFIVSDKALERISQREVCYAAGEFRKYKSVLNENAAHVALVEPSDMGNLGTIERTLLGFGIKNLAIIGESADEWHPRAVRASMGAFFRLNVEHFDDFETYLKRYGAGREIFPFMLDGGTTLTAETCPEARRYTLVFGNEARGLPAQYKAWGKSLFIPQSGEVDSLNLAVSVAVGTFLFTQKNGAF